MHIVFVLVSVVVSQVFLDSTNLYRFLFHTFRGLKGLERNIEKGGMSKPKVMDHHLNFEVVFV